MANVDLFEILEQLKTAAPEWAERIEWAMDEGKMVYFVSGCRKAKYGHESTALEAAEAMHKKTGDDYDAYQCPSPLCDSWHIGHAR